MNGLTQNKKRNQPRNETRAKWAMWQSIADKTYKIKRLIREDLRTGEITESSRSKMNAEVCFWLQTFEPLKTVPVLAQSVAWDALEKGATLFTSKAKFWIENPVEAIVNKPFKATLRYGNRKGLDFTKTESFETKEEAARWLVIQGSYKLCPEGEVVDGFGEIIYELSEEIYEEWAA